MPHECTTCGRTFDDGSKEMLSGCPDCGGNKFQYHPGRVDEGSSDDGAIVEDSTDSSFEFGPSAGSATGDEPSVADDGLPEDDPPSGEDRAQTSARSTVVSEEELALSNSDDPPETTDSGDPDSDAGETTPDAGESPSPELSELREELNEQFESIKIHDRGEYELNLMELYDREEHIVALQEDGRYVIDVPSSWREEDESG
jgi:predicted  nucleic acid-binding Zn-ribbon protein